MVGGSAEMRQSHPNRIRLVLKNVRILMPYYKKNTLFKTKSNRLHIFQRKDAKTNNV